MKIRFSTKEWNCRLKWLTYGNGNIALVASDMEGGSTVGILSVNTPEILPSDCVAIKDYSENEGVLKSLIANGVVGEPEYYIPSGFVQIPVCVIKNKKEW